MKLKLFISFVSFFIYNYLFSQDFLKIEYDRISSGSKKRFELVSNGNISKYEFLSSITNSNIEKISEEGLFIIKSFSDSTIYYKGNIFGKNFDVKDTLFTMNWKLSGQNKTILGYECHEAKTYFRGRYYTAFYTPQISYPDGPWKFNGLPGLILEVYSDDDEYKFIAQKINLNLKGYKLNNDYKYLNYITYNEFCLQFIEFLDKNVKRIIADRDISKNSTNTFKIGTLEIFYPKFQLGDGFTF